MLECSLIEPRSTHRWATIVSLTLQCSIAAAIVAVPLLRPASLVFHADAPRLSVPMKPAPPPLPKVVAAAAVAASELSSALASESAPAGRRFTLTRLRPNSLEDAPPSIGPVGHMGTGEASIPGTDNGTGNHPGPDIAVVSTEPVRISTGVLAGLLLAPITPIYPRMAIATRTEGTVVVDAIISESGAIKSAHATSGPPMLREAAIDAIRHARYTPYFLNGTPTEVQTTITVQFRLAN